MTEAFLTEALHLLVDQLQTIVNGKILTDVVYDQVKAALEDPRGGEESRPCLDGVVKDLGFGAHEETGIAANLAKVGVSHLGLDDGVYEIQRKRVIFHTHRV